MRAGSCGERESRLLPVLALTLLAGLLFCARLGCPLLEPEEARYAEIPRQMLAEGRWLVPVLHGEDYLQKPPLLYWLIMLSYQLFGVHDWAARLVPVSAGILVVLATYSWARSTVGARAALMSGLIICLSGRFLYLGGMVSMDSLLCLWVIGGLACGHVALQKKDEGGGMRDETQSARCLPSSLILNPRHPPLTTRHSVPWFLSAVCCGLGVMTKGPVAIALVAVPLAGWALLQKRGSRCRRTSLAGWLVYGAVILLVAGPWYVALYVCDAQATRDFFWLHNVVRYLAPFDHEKPAWFYLPSVAVGMLPWSLLLIWVIPALARRSRGLGENAATADRPVARPAVVSLPVASPPVADAPGSLKSPLGFFLLAFFWCLAFFSLSGCKRAGYILPALPLLALVLATSLIQVLTWNSRVKTGLALSAGVTALVLLVGSHFWLPSYHRHYALRGLVRRHAGTARQAAVACYPRRWDSVSFYLDRDAACFGPGEEDRFIEQLRDRDTLVFLKNDRTLEPMLRLLPAALEFVPLGRQGWNVRVGLVRPKSRE
jgi:4-amino-4-deoxy-L-arabinose transferase-like glycosyltransferase